MSFLRTGCSPWAFCIQINEHLHVFLQILFCVVWNTYSSRHYTQPPISGIGGHPGALNKWSCWGAALGDQPWQTAGLCTARACVCAPTACPHTSQAPVLQPRLCQRPWTGAEFLPQNSYPKITTLAWVLVWAKGSQKHSRFRESSLRPPQLLKFTLEMSPYQKRAVIRYTLLP